MDEDGDGESSAKWNGNSDVMGNPQVDTRQEKGRGEVG